VGPTQEDRPGESGGPVGESAAEEYLHGICFKTGPPATLGVELEWLPHDSGDPSRPPDPARLAAATERLRGLTLSGLLSSEPGGQLELSSRPASSLTACVAGTAADMAALRSSLAADGLVLAGLGHEPRHAPRRLLDQPRYAAMEAYFDRFGPEGRAMMCGTASVQVCLDAGTEEPGPLGLGRRWVLAHLLGAVLVAAFANSPLARGRPTGWRSTRQAVWAALDPARCCAPRGALDGSVDPRTGWTAYALDAPVLCVRRPAGPWTVPRGVLTFREWARGGGPAAGVDRPPTLDDLEYHLSTLFPPVRPRGYLELRMIDAQPGPDGWVVPLAVTTALFDDPAAAETAYRAVKPLADSDRESGDGSADGCGGDGTAPRDGLWRRAARRGLTDPELRSVAATCFAAARQALPRLGAEPELLAAVDAFTERYVARGRCPADDLLDEHLPAGRTAGDAAGSAPADAAPAGTPATKSAAKEDRP
jgi:glutamate--cysteine ligase